MSVIRACVIAFGVAFSTLTYAEPGSIRGVCMNDVKALCGSVQPGGGRIRDCIREHRTQLSNACKLAIADRMLERRQQKSERRVPRKGAGEKSDE